MALQVRRVITGHDATAKMSRLPRLHNPADTANSLRRARPRPRRPAKNVGTATASVPRATIAPGTHTGSPIRSRAKIGSARIGIVITSVQKTLSAAVTTFAPSPSAVR